MLNQQTPESQQPVSNAFTRLLSEFLHGASLGELSEAMTKCVASAKEHGKPAELKYVIRFSPQGEAMVVTDKIETKLPTADRDGAVFFPTEDNNLSRDNPGQTILDLRAVEPTQHELKEMPAPAAQIA